MKTLILIRHAKSSWNEMGMSDFERSLNARGLADAPLMGERLSLRLADAEQTLDVLLSSSAQRAEQTARLLAAALAFPEHNIAWHRELYLAAPQTMLELIQTLPDQVTTAALVAHNPGISELAEKLTGERFGDVPTCAVITIELPIDHWLDAGNWADLMDYDFPKRPT